MFTPHPLRDKQTAFYLGRPQETYYSQNAEYRPTYEDVAHLIPQDPQKGPGQLMHIFADWEATDKDRTTAQPTQFGAVMFDLNMRLVGKLDLNLALGNLHPMAIQAALVARAWPDEMKHGWPGYIGMGMYRDFLLSGSHLDGETLGLKSAQFRDGTKGFHYSLNFPDLPKPLVLEINEAGNQMRFPGERLDRKKGQKWGRDLHSATRFFNGDKYDVNLAAFTAARYGMASLFHASRSAHDATHLDPLAAARWFWAFSEKRGKDGLQFLPRYHVKTRREVISFTQNDILRANSPAAYRALGRTGGIILYDGTEYDPERAHGAYPDSMGTAALYALMRKTDPAALRFLETHSSEQSQKDFLQSAARFEDRPLVGFVHYDEGMISRGIGLLINTGDTYGQERKNELLVFNACYDPKIVATWTDSQLKATLVQKHNPLAVAFRANHTAQFADFERAHKAGAGIDMVPHFGANFEAQEGRRLTVNELQQRRMDLVNNRFLMDRIMAIWSEVRHPPRAPNVTTIRQPEEQTFNHYGDLDAIVTPNGEVEPADIHIHFKDKWDTTRKFDTLLREMMEVHAVEYSNDDKAVDDYVDRYKKLAKRVEDLQATWADQINLPSILPDTREECIKHLWNLRVSLHDHLFNYLPERFLVDENGNALSVDQAMQVPREMRIERFKPEDRATGQYWKCVFERQPDLQTFRLLDMVFDEADPFYRNHISPDIRKWWVDFYDKEFAAARPWYDARVALAVNGPPNLEPSKHPSMTVARSAYEAAQLRIAARKGPGSDWHRFVTNTKQGEQILAAWEAKHAADLKRHKLTADQMDMMGYDPATKAPYLHHFFDVPRKDVVRLVVPDSILDEPLFHQQHLNHLIIAKPDKSTLQALDATEGPNRLIVLEGAATGMERLAVVSKNAAPAAQFCFPLPKTSYENDAVEAARSAYASIGEKLGSSPFILKCEQLAPIHDKRAVDAGVQSVAIPALDWAGLVDGKAASLPEPKMRITEILVQNVGQRYRATANEHGLRLQRVYKGRVTGDEYHGWLQQARQITLQQIETSGQFDDAWAMRAGKLSKADLVSEWRATFAGLGINKPSEQKLWLLSLAKPVSKSTYTYFKPDAFPVAVYEGEPRKPLRAPKFQGASHRRAA